MDVVLKTRCNGNSCALFATFSRFAARGSNNFRGHEMCLGCCTNMNCSCKLFITASLHSGLVTPIYSCACLAVFDTLLYSDSGLSSVKFLSESNYYFLDTLIL